jgi:hypothetical protein
MIGQSFVVVFPDGTYVEPDTFEVAKHDTSAEVTAFPVELGVNLADHAILKQDSLEVTGLFSDSPLDPTLEPKASGDGGFGRAMAGYMALDAAVKARKPVMVTAGLRSYNAAILTKLTVEDSIKEAGRVRFALALVGVQFAEADTVKVKRLARKHHAKRVAKGGRFADKIEAVRQGKAEKVD